MSQVQNPFDVVPQKDYYLIIKRFKQWYPQFAQDMIEIKEDLNDFYIEVVKGRDQVIAYEKGDTQDMTSKELKEELQQYQDYADQIASDVDNYIEVIKGNIDEINKYEKQVKPAVKELDKRTLNMYNQLQSLIQQSNTFLRKIQGIKQEGEVIAKKATKMLENTVE